MPKFLLISCLLLFTVIASPSVEKGSLMSFQYATAEAADQGGMAKVQLILKKMRSSMSSLKDLDELEKVGMSKRDVDRMRRAMNQKIKQMTDQAVDLIIAL